MFAAHSVNRVAYLSRSTLDKSESWLYASLEIPERISTLSEARVAAINRSISPCDLYKEIFLKNSSARVTFVIIIRARVISVEYTFLDPIKRFTTVSFQT